MFGIRYIKVPPTIHVMQFKGGSVVREGAGLSFFYFAPASTLVHVPLSSSGVPFVFNEVTADFQDATIQGELTYRITQPAVLASLLDFSVDAAGRYRTDDPGKLNDRLIHATQILTRGFTQKKNLKELLASSDDLVSTVLAGVKSATAVTMLGL
ncbi:MAG: hypothetical protein KDA99_11195, partial [Planctomycetales bacterium]|nr:hypothetical protein [Planctomycetales bacterium]